MVQKGAFKTLKKKPKKLAKKFSFWNEDLRLTRNKVNKLFKIYRKHKAENSNVDLIQSSGNAYKREQAVFKKLLLKTKRKAWEDFCVNYNNRFGSLFKLVFNKSTGENSIGVSPNNDPNNSIVDRITHIMDFFFPGKSPDDNFVFNPIVGPISSLTIEDLEITFGNLKGGKAPVLDRIDYRMWRAVFITDKIFMQDLFNRCFILNYFPRCLRNARVFFLLKDGKDPGLCNSYRPVCLLPTLGKVVERLFLIKLNGWLDQHNIIHDNQYGFREGRSCDLAIHTLVEAMKFKMNTDHLALVSLDIKSAFDNMNWSVLFKIFNDIGLSSFYRNFIFYYLCDRTVLYINDVCETTRHCFKGCPQGSVIAPVSWNIYINTILCNNNTTFYTQAFADDLALVVSGRRARDLESNTNSALEQIALNLSDLKLKLSAEKCQALIVRSISSYKFSKRNCTVLNRKPTLKINGYSIKISDSLKILGIVLDNKFTWSPHILSLHNKALFLTCNFNRIVKTKWSLNKNLIKLWYSTVIEKALLYGASVWGEALTKQQVDRLHSIQRIFLLKFTRAYRTTSTNVLNTLTGIPPLHVIAKTEFIKFRIWAGHANLYTDILGNIQLNNNISIKNIPSSSKFIILNENISNADFEVYTDGSRIEDETGFAVCIFQENNNIENHLYKLKSHNSVFQAELAAIHCAANWAASKNVSINIHTDSLSSIAAIKSASARSSFVNNIKQDLVKIKHLVGLSWVKAHVGIQGNELADQQAKLATTTGVDTIIPAPRSYVKRLLNKLMIKEWNDCWRQYNSTIGARVREYVEHVSPKFLIHSKFLIFFLSGHGPFPFYLCRFKILDSPLCVCGQVGDADHYTFSCSLTQKFHLVKPADAHKRAWFQNLINNSQALNKLKEAFRISGGVCDSLTQAV
ncbi:Putative protein in type-1 retrotransposable element R1DM [Araneus ventricosus]|uniref:Retrovirus-related Pol polyprotein from type-1 retrotransposable element R1 n=1 Tax=Araneus ventricosus TaxID=182803 RepID=A0A4Y2NUC2_ARAVE|nr:Putative protein in type-1 retrotransposable element R1DM [Araneus ventricosus]